jgi:hypothetical protein
VKAIGRLLMIVVIVGGLVLLALIGLGLVLAAAADAAERRAR